MNETWGILELLGHRRLAGIISEESVAGVGMIRIDIPGAEGGMTTQFYAPGALYCLTPTDESTARAFSRDHQPEPVHRWELALPDPREEAYEIGCADDDEEESEGGDPDFRNEFEPESFEPPVDIGIESLQ